MRFGLLCVGLVVVAVIFWMNLYAYPGMGLRVNKLTGEMQEWRAGYWTPAK